MEVSFAFYTIILNEGCVALTFQIIGRLEAYDCLLR